MDRNTATVIETLAPVADTHTFNISESVTATPFGLENLMALRDALFVLKGPLGNIPALRTTIQNRLLNQAARDRLLR
jgi:predicted component of type VI protein secretion system